MRIAVTGHEGQVVRSLLERGPAAGHDIIALGRPQLDLAGNPGDIIDVIGQAQPDAIVSAAAYTAVDRAETEQELALVINVSGAEAVARAANGLRVPLIHLSTDYVFDGSKSSPYREDDATSPTSVYGETKLAGERAVLEAHSNVAILRTAWVYSPFGSNFVKTMLRLAQDRDEIAVVDDQRGNPTSALDIADGILAIAANLAGSPALSLRGIFHMAGGGEASWAEFAEAIFSASAAVGGPACRVRRITTQEFPTPAKRPANSRLNSAKLAQAHGVRLPDWHQSAATIVARLARPTV
jgi:dTDP-4-dehydrorhamnose reductase